MPYAAPLADMRLTLDAVAGLGGEMAELADPVLEEAARFAAAELDPLNQPADRTGSVLENGIVRTPPGFREAYRRYAQGGWMGSPAIPRMAARACRWPWRRRSSRCGIRPAWPGRYARCSRSARSTCSRRTARRSSSGSI